MKKVIRILLVSICCIIFVACDSSEEHPGQAKTPSGSSIMKGRDYKSVVEAFEENGFTNIKLEKIEDLVLGWLTEEGEVEEVSVGGDFEYSPDDWVEADTEVVIRYHVFPAEETEQKSEEDTTESRGEEVVDEVLTIENCEEFANMLLSNGESYEEYEVFSSKYKGRTIEFDGRIDHIMNHGNYDTRYDILVFAGDYDPNHQIGPAFKFEDVNALNLGLDTLCLQEKIQVGKNVRIVAKVDEFDRKSCLFFLNPISVTER